LTVPDQNSPVLYDTRTSGVVVVTLNRPERLNAWGGGLAAEFYRCLDRAEADPAVLAPHVRSVAACA
jgi:enoyl-CoA hydratase/carnithine racemase